MQRRVFLGTLAAGAAALGRQGAAEEDEGEAPARPDRLRLVRRGRPRGGVQGRRRRGGRRSATWTPSTSRRRRGVDRGLQGSVAAHVQGLAGDARRAGPRRPWSSPPRPTGTRSRSSRPAAGGSTSTARSRSPTTCARGGRWSTPRRRAAAIVQIGFQRRQSEAIRQAREVHRRGPRREDRARSRPRSTTRPSSWTRRPSTRRRPSTGTSGAVRPRSCPTARRSATSTGASRRPTATATSWTGASTGSTRSATSSASACRGSILSAGGLYRLKGRITTPDVLTAHFEFDQCPVVWSHRIFGQAEVHARDEHRHVLLRREGDRLPHRRALRRDPGREGPAVASGGAGERRTVEAKNDQQTAHVGRVARRRAHAGHGVLPPGRRVPLDGRGPARDDRAQGGRPRGLGRGERARCATTRRRRRSSSATTAARGFTRGRAEGQRSPRPVTR